nr:AsmA family protein [Pedobacter sp. ASV19]
MAKQRKISKIWKWIIVSFLSLFLLIGAAVLYFSIKWKPRITKRIKTEVYNGSHHLYKIDFKDIHLNILLGNVTLDTLTLIPDTTAFRMLRDYGLAPSNIFQVKLAHLKLSGISVLKAYFKKKIDISSILLDQPSVHMIHNDAARKKKEEGPSLFEMLSGTFKSVHVGQIKMTNADIDYISGTNWEKLHQIRHFNLRVEDLLLDSASRHDPTRFYYAKDVAFELMGYSALSKDKMYTTKIDTLRGSATGGTLKIRGLKMVPMYGELEFTRKYKVQKDRYTLDFSALDFKGLNFTRLDDEGRLHASSLQVESGKAAVFMNRELPPPSFDKGKNYPHIALQRLPLQLLIDTIQLHHIDVAYTEYNPIAKQKGTVELNHLHGQLLNITNDTLQLTKKSHAYADLRTRIMKAADLHVKIDFNLLDRNGAFHYSGNVGPMDMVALNPLAKSLGLVKIEQGKVQKADFDIQANLQGSKGTMHFYYNGLKVSILKEGEDGAPAKKRGFLSFLANKLVIIDANPSEGKPLRTANIIFHRSPAASFFNLLWKGVFVGMRETIGIGMLEVKSPEKAYEKVKDKKKQRLEKKTKG